MNLKPIAIADPQPTIPVVQQPIDDLVMPQSSKHKDTSTPTQKASTSFSTPRLNASDANITHIDFQSNNPCDLLRKLQDLAPPGMKYCLTLAPHKEETSFKKILKHKKQRILTQVIIKNAQSKRRIKMAGAVITSKEVIRQIIEKAKGKKEEEKRKLERKKKKEKKREAPSSDEDYANPKMRNKIKKKGKIFRKNFTIFHPQNQHHHLGRMSNNLVPLHQLYNCHHQYK